MIVGERFAGFTDAGFLAIKLTAFGLMVLDHLDWFVFGGALGINATFGRVVFPAFAFVLGVNLARMSDAAMRRLLVRLLVAGAVASLPYVYLQGAWLPLNVLFSLAAAVGVVALVRLGLPTFALLLWLASGMLVDYLWCGIAAVVAVWWLTQRGYGYGLLVAALLVVPINLSLWSLAVVPLNWLALVMPHGQVPRLKWLFYVGYPAHLVVLAVIAAVL